MRYLILLIVGYGALVGEPRTQGLPERDDEKKQTTWEVSSIQLDGKEIDLDRRGVKQLVVLSVDKASLFVGKKLEVAFRLKVDEAATPKAVDLIDDEGFVCRGIYEREGDNLKVCIIYAYRRQPDRPRPKTFETQGQLTTLYILRKVK